MVHYNNAIFDWISNALPTKPTAYQVGINQWKYTPNTLEGVKV